MERLLKPLRKAQETNITACCLTMSPFSKRHGLFHIGMFDRGTWVYSAYRISRSFDGADKIQEPQRQHAEIYPALLAMTYRTLDVSARCC